MHFNYDFTLLLFIFLRMSGCIIFNTIFGRKSVPTTLKVGLTLILTLTIYSSIPAQNIVITSFVVLCVELAKELLIGFILGFVINMFSSIIILGGEYIDMQIGISMSKIYDPQSNVSMPLSASLMNATFMLIFFSTNAHLTLIQIFSQTCIIIPYGGDILNEKVFSGLVLLFQSILIYSVKLSLPILAAEIIAEMGVGILMKAVPQINVFVVNLQLKIIIGFFAILILVPSMSGFFEKIIVLMFDNMNQIISAFI